MNTLTQQVDDLGKMHHGPILDAIEAVLRSQPVFTRDEQGRLCIDAEGIAWAVWKSRRWSEREILTPPPRGSASVCTLNMEPAERDTTRSAIQEIAETLDAKLADHAREHGRTVTELVQQHVGRLSTTSPFGRLDNTLYKTELGRKAPARRKRLTFRAPLQGAGPPLMRWHKLTITVQVPKDMTAHLAAAVQRHLQQQWRGISADELEDLAGILDDQAQAPNSDLNQLTRGLQTETIGQLKKEALLYYLAFLGQQLDEKDAARDELRELVRRLRLLQAWTRDPKKADADYEVVVAGEAHNLRTLFAQSDAFDALPVVPIIDGYVGETTSWDTHEQQYIFGTKLKLNGSVQRFDKLSSFAYHLELLRGQRPMRGDRLARLAILYFVVFASYNTPSFDPIAALETEILPQLRAEESETGQNARAVFADIANRCQSANPNDLAASLRKLVQRVKSAEPRTWDVQIRVGTGLVDANRRRVLSESRIFHDVFAPDKKAYLGYITVGPPRSGDDSLFSLDAQIRYEDVQCYEGEGAVEGCEVTYNAGSYTVLPVFLSAGRPKPGTRETPAVPGVVIPCKVDEQLKELPERTPAGWFIYRYTFALISYLTLQALGERAPKPLFISLARSHRQDEDQNEKENPEGFLAMLGKLLAQVLGMDHAANSQGLVISQQGQIEPWRVKNAIASLYAPLPKAFQFSEPVDPKIPRLAIVAVSARESDRVRDRLDTRMMTIAGEVIKIEQTAPKTVQVSRAATLCGTYPQSELYSRPDAILDRIHTLYDEGFRHILYVAQAPYSNLLHLTRPEEREGLYFMSRAIIEACVQGKADLRIYPIFRDQYHAMKIRPLGANALYIQDTLDLTRVVDGRGGPQQMVVFLNLFSGQAGVGRSEADGSYNGVVSYATLLNVYGGVLDDSQIRAALIDDAEGPNLLKNTIVRYLTLFHLSRYEVARNAVNLKLDPYSDIIGDDSVGAIAVHPHIDGRTRFNFLAFLAEARNAVKAH